MRGSPLETEAIERELDDTRSRLDATIGALQQKLAPGSMVDQAVHYFKEGGGVEFSRNLGRSMRDNPVPVAMIGVGLGWLMYSGMRGHNGSPQWRGRPWRRDERYGVDLEPDFYGRRRSGIREEVDASVHQPMPYEAAAYDDVATKAHRAGSEVMRSADESEEAWQDRVHAARASVLGVARHAGEAAHSFRERVADAMHSAATSVRSATTDAGATASHLVARGQSALGQVGDRAGQAAGQMRDLGGRTVDYVQEQPLILGAIGITVGAAIGMLIPASRYERRMVGSLREQIGDTARGVAGEAGRRAMRVAETVLDTAQEATQREGLADVSGSGLAASAREKMTDVAGRARHVVEETAQAGRDAVRRELAGSGDGDTATGPRKGNGTPTDLPAGQHGERRPAV